MSAAARRSVRCNGRRVDEAYNTPAVRVGGVVLARDTAPNHIRAAIAHLIALGPEIIARGVGAVVELFHDRAVRAAPVAQHLIGVAARMHQHAPVPLAVRARSRGAWS